jgi:hypothetical protein
MLDLGKLLDLLILARNSKDEGTLQEAINMVAFELGLQEETERQLRPKAN